MGADRHRHVRGQVLVHAAAGRDQRRRAGHRGLQQGSGQGCSQIKPTRTISQAEEAELYRHYGVEYGESRSGSGLPETSPTGANGEPGITEGQGRLKKHLVSERVTGVMPSERDNVVIEPESTATDDTPDRRQ